MRPRARVRGRGRTAIAAIVGLALVALAVAAPGASALNFSAGQNAERQLGAPAGGWTSRTFHSVANMSYGMSFPNGVGVDSGGSVYVADTVGNRVMRWAATPASDGAAMTNVVMKTDSSQASWQMSCTGGADHPEQISIVGDGATTRMLVVDRQNSRVVGFTTEPTTDGATGTIFLGQASGSSCSSNRGGSPASNTLDGPSGVWTDGTRVAVADSANNRVLLWDSWPGTGQAADRVLGQANFTSVLANRGGAAAADTLARPKSVWFDGTWLYVADADNNRVLAFNGWPAANGAAATNVIGQPNFTTTTTACTSTKFNYPVAVTSTGSGAGHRLAISLESQRRVVVLDAWPSAPGNGSTFSSVLGQPDLSSCSMNRSAASAAANSLRMPAGLQFDGSGNLWVVDSTNHRVLRFPSTTTGTSANRVLGHPDFTSNTNVDSTDDNVFQLAVGMTDASINGARIAMSDAGVVAVAEPEDSSIRLWTTAPAADNAAFTLRYGQTARDRAGFDGPGNTIGAGTLDRPTDVWTDGTRMLVADRENDRVLAWTALPTTDTDAPDFVLGQANFTSSTSSTSQTGMDKPTGVTSDGVDVFVAESSSDRILIFRNFWLTPSNGKAADVVLGQANFTSGSSGVGADRLTNPKGLAVDSRRRLAVADHGNHRVLVWTDHSTVTNGQPADVVIGQSNFTNSGAGGAAEDALGVEFAGGGLLWTEDCSVRYLDPVPANGAVTASTGQVGTGCAGQTPAQNAIDSPSGVAAGGGRVWVANSEHARMMRWVDTTTPTITVVPTATVRCDGTVTVSWTTSESTTTEIRWDTVSRASWAGGYANQSIDTSYTGLVHTHELSFATPGTKYVRVRAEDWNAQSVVSGEISFTVPSTCPAPTTMLGDDANAQTGRANPSATNTPPIRSTTFRTAWQNVSGVTMDRVDAQTWSTPPEHAGGMWHLDGSTSADANAQSANAVTWTGAQPYTTGRFGQAATFTADGQYGTITSAASFTKANAFTFDLWFRTSSIANTPYPIMAIKSDGGCGSGQRCNYALEFDRGANNVCGVIVNTSNAEVQACRTATGLLDGQWHHALMTVSSTNAVRLYIDGALAGGPTASAAPPRTGADPITIGRASDGVEHFRGSVDEVRFAPVFYDDAAVLGYYRTRRAHLDQLWNQGSTALGANCSTATRCGDQTYAGAPEILRSGARYWMRTRFNTLNNDYWTDRGVDWFETTSIDSINISVGSAVTFGTVLPGADVFGSSTIDVTTNAAAGYQLLARDESDAWGMERTGGGAQPTIPDRQDGATPPATWAAGTPGFFGFTVRSATGNRLAKWGTPPGGFGETDTTNNLYTALEATTDVLVHERTTYGTATDSVVVTWRANAGAGQAPGTYDGLMTLTALANP